MSKTRDRLDHARRAYGHVRYPGDLADDVFARLDDAGGGALQKSHPAATMRIDRATPSPWRPVLAIAATVAALASAVAVLVHNGRDGSKTLPIAMTDPTPPVAVEPTVAAAEEESNVDFTIVPSYQSFAFSVPTSLTPASVDEYDRQAREATTTGERTATDRDPTSVQ